VCQVIGLEKGHNDTANHLNVDPSTAHRIRVRFEQPGDVNLPNTDVTKLTNIGKYFTLDLVIDKPGIYQQEELPQATGIRISEARICCYLQIHKTKDGI